MEREYKLDWILTVIAIILSIFLFYSMVQTIIYEVGTFEKRFWAFNMMTTLLVLISLIGIEYLILKMITPRQPEEDVNKKKKPWRKLKIFIIIIVIIAISFECGSALSMFYILVLVGEEAIQVDIHFLFFYVGLWMGLFITIFGIFFFPDESKQTNDKKSD
ncbi:MAG: hypothetical protein CEE43_10835 [Promethearchaeota archaeon Loki_b32]|nr:MAG: hypothetical protein CEE43_10835 [Candidatus Lokiarchaeota archaeon Loki_b32]